VTDRLRQCCVRVALTLAPLSNGKMFTCEAEPRQVQQLVGQRDSVLRMMRMRFFSRFPASVMPE